MTEADVVSVAHALREAGASILFRLPGAMGGGSYVDITPEIAAELIANPDRFVHRRLGVTGEQFEAWEENEHIPLCGGWNKKGARCGNAVDGMVDAAEFAARHRIDMCRVHA